MARRSRCHIEGCENDNRSRGLCMHHRRREDRYGDALYEPTILDRFFAKVDAEGDCWEWTANKDKDGYGKFRDGDKHYRAHRFVYEQMVGPIPDGLVIDHLCKNTSCVNPDHIEPVTWAENLHRGASIQAKHARRRTCPRGHEYDATQGNGKYRKCRTCVNEARRVRRAKEVMSYR